MNKKEYINLKVEIHDLVIMDFNGIITQNSIVDLARTVEATLIDYNEDELKIRTIFETIIEVMQNILSYSYDSIDLGNNTFQSNGHILISLGKGTSEYKITAGNLIDKNQKETISTIINEANSLNPEELKELYKERRRNRRRNHDRGAGLGFIDISRKSKNKLNYEFSDNDNDSLMFELHITI